MRKQPVRYPEKIVPTGRDAMPVDSVKWVARGELRANGYNPNKVAPPELRLLRRSILEDGWTQPIVVRADGERVLESFTSPTVARRAWAG